MAGRILIVEDSPQVAANLEIALTPLGEILVTSHAEGALAVLSAGPVAAVITDLDLPGMSGFELLAWIRGEPRYAKIPVIVASGSTDPHPRERSMAAGANAFFAKPYSPAELRRELARLMELER